MFFSFSAITCMRFQLVNNCMSSNAGWAAAMRCFNDPSVDLPGQWKNVPYFQNLVHTLHESKDMH